MKKATILALALIMPVVAALASPVDKEAAKATATAFLQQKVASASGRHNAPKQLNLVSAQEENAPYYVFNNTNGQGFAIVSGEDTANQPILGYSTEGSLTEENMPDALRAILSDYAKVVEFAQQNGLSMKRAPRKANRADVTPFIEYEWNQSAPYNNQAPISSGTTHSSLGCMPVTVSMIVAHFRYPETLPAAYNGNYTNPATKYSYENFKKSYSKYATSLDSVDVFMYHIANLLSTNYSSSSAQESALLPAFKNTLGYNPYMRTLRRDAYSAEDWDELIYNELAAGRPVNFVGSHQDLGGHSYITDGYRASDGFYHMIWGWGSTCVGYFDINILNPFIEYISQWGGMGYDCPPAGFTQDLKAVVGIQPTATEPVASVLTVDNYSKEGTSKYRAMFFNYNSGSYTGKISWAILGEDDSFTLLENIQPTTVTNVTSYTYSTIDVSQLNFSEGDYKIVPVCKTNDETEWNLCQGYKQKYVEVKVADGETTAVAHPVVDLNVDGLVYQRVTGEYIEMVLDITNNGDDTFGSLHITGVRDDGVVVDGSRMDIAVSAGKKQMLSVFIATGGNYSGHTYEVSVKYMNKVIWTGTIDPAAYSSNYSTYERVEFEDYEYVDGNAYLYNTTLKGDIIIKSSKWYVHNLPVKVTLKDDNDNIVYQKTQQQLIPKDTEARYSICAEGLQPNKTYYLTAQVIKVTRSGSTYTETVAGSFFTDFAINVRVGVPYYNENGKLERLIITDEAALPMSMPANAAAVDFRSFSPELVNLSSITNENCVYVFNEGAEVPAELDGKNVVVGNTAEELNLVDGKPVAFPVAFTAANATYTRQMENDNWNTIVVPFAATVKVEGEDADIDWFRRGEANGRKFWLYKFNGSDAASVYFDGETATVMTPNTPYLISVPGNKWGEEYNLSDKALVFHGQNVGITTDKPEVATNFYTFKGTYTSANTNGGYKLNADGDFFELQTSDVMENPFHAFFLGSESTNNSKRALTLNLGEVPTLIMDIENAQQTIENIFDLQGRRVQNAQKGIYIQNGKKVVIK